MLLLVQYHSFKVHTDRLLALKEDYSGYVTALKKVISMHAEKKNEIIPAGVKGPTKIISSEEDDGSEGVPTFLVVNREPAYLRESATAYARKHNVAWALGELYAADAWVASTATNKRAVLKKRAPARLQKKVVRAQTLSKSMLLKKTPAIVKNPIFSWPIERSRFWISSPFGPRKNKGKFRFHYGLDMAAAKGTPVVAAASGVVVEAEQKTTGYGTTVVIAHNKKYKTRYAHLSKLFVTVGQKVARGEHIGDVGNTGSVRSRWGGDGTHLHFEVQVFGKKVNPIYFLS